jgi:hypothetical protein
LRLINIGEQIEGIWHTGIVVYGKEWFFSVDGIHSVKPVSFKAFKSNT